MNYFKILELNEEYNLDKAILNQQYLKMQALWHPDKATTAQEKQEFLAASTLINAAYNLLKDDFKRAEYILQQQGYVLEAYKLDSKSLQKIWDEAESIEELTTEEQIDKFLKSKIIEKQEALQNLSRAFRKLNYKEAFSIIVSLKYLNNLIEKLMLRK